MIKRSISVLLAVVMIISVITTLPFTANAQEIEITAEGANVELTETGYTAHSQSEAVQWARDQEGKAFDSNYGYQCVNLIRAYYDYLGVPLPTGNANTYLNDSANHKPDGWTINWGAGGMQPGDIMVYNGGSWGHVAIVIELGDYSCTVMQQNGDNKGEYRTEASKCHYGTSYYTGITGYIHPDFYAPPATNAWLNIDRSEIVTGETITFSFGADNANGYYTIGIDKGSQRIVTENIRNSSYSYTFNEAGDYSAYVTCYGDGGLADTNRVYFTVHERIPASNAWIEIDQNTIEQGQSIAFTFGADHSNGYYTIGIDKGNNRIHTEDIRTTTYTYTFNEVGEYSAYVTCYGYGGLADTERVYFTVTKPLSAENAWIRIDKNTIEKGQSVTFTYGAEHSNGYYTIGIDKDDKRIHTEDIQTTSYTYTLNEIGNYSAYVTCYGNGGLADTERVYFTVTNPLPASNAWITADKETIEKGQTVVFSFGADHSNGYYTIGIDKGENRIHTENTQTTSYSYTFSEAGDYGVYVTCYGNGGLSDTEKVYINVYEKFPALNAWIKIDDNRIQKGQAITFTYGAEHANGYYTIGIDKDRNRIHTADIQTTSYTYTFTEIGEYSAYVTFYGDGGLADTDRVYFTVYEVILGDVDGDGEVTIIDATAIQRHLASIPTASYIEKAADADGDGSVTILDATAIQRHLAQLLTNENIGKPIA